MKKVVILCTARSIYIFISFQIFYEVLDLGPPVNASVRSPVFMCNVALSILVVLSLGDGRCVVLGRYVPCYYDELLIKF